MAISKIILNGVTQMDLTGDTVAASNLIAPNTAHGADGQPVVGTASAGITPTGTIPITENGTVDVTQYASASVNVPTGSSMNVQVAQGCNRVNTTTYTAVSGQSITVAKTGKYDVYWTGFRSSTGGTNGSQLYIGDTAYGTAQETFSNNCQSIKLTNVSLTKDDVIAVRARSRGTNYYMYVGNLTIVQTA